MICVARLVFNPFAVNTYILYDGTRDCIVVDPGNYSSREDAILTEFLSERGLRPVMALCTHGHVDHILGVDYVKRVYGVPFAVSSDDGFLLDSAKTHGAIYGFDIQSPPKPDIDLKGEDKVSFGDSELMLVATPGHTPGHLCLYNKEQKIALTGDTLFRESIGRTDLPGGDYSWIMKSILEKIVPLGDEMTIYPGHGGESTIGHELLYNPFIVEVIQGEVRP